MLAFSKKLIGLKVLLELAEQYCLKKFNKSRNDRYKLIVKHMQSTFILTSVGTTFGNLSLLKKCTHFYGNIVEVGQGGCHQIYYFIE